MTGTVIEVRALCKRFGGHEVLRGVELDISRGAVVGLVGTNGAGKTTLIKCLLGLLRFDAGRASVLGEAPGSLSAEAKARLGYAPQEVRLYPWMTARQVIAYTAAFYPFWDQPWVDELAERWQLPLNRRVGTLSTGQVQKLALILALGHRPELLVLDEPVSSLDPLARREFVKSLVAMTNDGEHTVLFSTHITSDVERVATHVAVLRDGRIACYDELDAIKDRVKRLRLRAAQDLPGDFAVHGALRTKVEGRQALVAVADVDPDMLDALRDRWQADVTVEDLNLEEIFLEMHDG